jgi:hypothetical protein
MHVLVSHVFREGNFVAEKLANLGLSLNDFTWWNFAPSSIWAELAGN